jgi:hypothetical protein
MSDLPAAQPGCEHSWAFHLYGGLSARLCQFCHEPDWDDLRGQLEEAGRKGELAGRAKVQHAADRVAQTAAAAQEKAVTAAVTAEREGCAQLAEQHGAIYPFHHLAPEVMVDGEPVPVTTGGATIWPASMPPVAPFAALLRQGRP